jgi:hypothetical protein
LIRIRIQHFRLNTGTDPKPDSDPIKIELQVKTKLIFFIIIATEAAFSPQKRTSSTSNMKFLNLLYFSGSFLPSWIRIRIPYPDTDRPTNLTESGYNPDPSLGAETLPEKEVVLISGNRKSKSGVTLPAGEYESRASLGQIQRGLEAKSHIRARDDNHLQF